MQGQIIHPAQKVKGAGASITRLWQRRTLDATTGTVFQSMLQRHCCLYTYSSLIRNCLNAAKEAKRRVRTNAYTLIWLLIPKSWHVCLYTVESAMTEAVTRFSAGKERAMRQYSRSCMLTKGAWWPTDARRRSSVSWLHLTRSMLITSGEQWKENEEERMSDHMPGRF